MTRRTRDDGGRWAKKHGARSLEKYIRRNGLDGRSRTAKAIRQIEQQLDDEPIATLRDLWRGRYARKEVAAQVAEQQLAKTNDPGMLKWLLGLWNSLRRDAELLVALPDPTKREPSLHDYLKSRETASVATTDAPPGTADRTAALSAEAVPVSPSTDADAADSPAARQEPQS